MKEQKILYGCLPAKYDARDYTICSANANVTYPEEFVLDNLPVIKNQTTVNSCCAHATSSILEYHADNKFLLSTNFIYGIQKKLFNQCGMGMYLAQACQIVLQHGDPIEADCKGNNEIPTCYEIAEEAFDSKEKMNSAYRFRINSYYLCSTDNDIKYALMNFGPVLGAIYWRDNFVLDADNVVQFDTQSNGGGHAIVIVGWNKKGWIIQNSWGIAFGNNGRFILPFAYGFSEARAIVDVENDSELFDNGVLNKPYNNVILDFFYRIYNFIVNLFRREN